MRRRQFLALIGTAVTAWPLAAPAQTTRKTRTIGFLGPLTQSAMSLWTAAFVRRLSELGWTEGGNLTINYRWANGRSEQLGEIASELVRLKVDVIVTGGTAAVAAARQATSDIPIVFGVAGDPVRLGLVSSLARPGGNVTGLSNQSAELPGKRLALLREAIPGLQRLAILANVGGLIGILEMREVETAARSLGLEVFTLEIQKAEDIEPVFGSLKTGADALYVVTDPVVNSNRIRINTLALAAQLPTLHAEKAYVEAGGLISYGPNFPDLFRRAAEMVDKVFRGTKPAEIPVEQPTRFDLVISVKTAKALGVTIPAQLLARADEVIE
jgi:putative ABC transport system substrate-binding protein